MRSFDKSCVNEGVGNLSLRKVAEKAGATIGLITHHFPNRAAMVKAAVEYAWEKAKKQIKWPTTVNEAEIIACLEAFLPLEQPRRRELSVWLAFWALTQTPRSFRKSTGASTPSSATSMSAGSG
ncbi:TetR/AcrR family transcriptional regulator [Rhizobium sp. TRM96647]|uniref:TetR/AcrR family transcriptional regulator n=1 Tax=unclassified Rhizobium TaxID=2613769 RepID=UPI0021E6EB20|nr:MULTISPECIES: TetR/AcrR family transcriptional regulator [unclassified Rhizobium]MCV3739412.1 TetR/AcrR family transcriptional regulator [Rhizobium sp. TRM96647]MCV3761078.1 TetR/AcrR family transcriptional regulator [Rhizobium sp. TRM96650]